MPYQPGTMMRNGDTAACWSIRQCRLHRIPAAESARGTRLARTLPAHASAAAPSSICGHPRGLDHRDDARDLAFDQLLQADGAAVGTFRTRASEFSVAVLHVRVID